MNKHDQQTGPGAFDAGAHAVHHASVLGLTIDPQWMPSVITNIELIETAAQVLMSFDLPDDVESATIFHP